MVKVYAAGSMATAEETGNGGDWRKTLPEIDGVEWLYPVKPPGACKDNMFNPPFFITQDFVNINRSDLVLVVFEGGEKAPAQHGTCTEVGYCSAINRPMLAVCPDDHAKFRFKFPLSLIPAVVSTMDEAFDIINFAAGNFDGENWI